MRPDSHGTVRVSHVWMQARSGQSCEIISIVMMDRIYISAWKTRRRTIPGRDHGEIATTRGARVDIWEMQCQQSEGEWMSHGLRSHVYINFIVSKHIYYIVVLGRRGLRMSGTGISPPVGLVYNNNTLPFTTPANVYQISCPPPIIIPLNLLPPLPFLTIVPLPLQTPNRTLFPLSRPSSVQRLLSLVDLALLWTCRPPWMHSPSLRPQSCPHTIIQAPCSTPHRASLSPTIHHLATFRA
jgi:hypothetical protein